jgi:HAE1 family hydrophobic/amphiphilic exporter-1
LSFLTELALRRKSVTILLILMVLVGGILNYRTLPVELFPEIEFPLITISTFYPSANPEAVVRDVTLPIETAIAGLEGLENVQSFSTENRSLVLANFQFGIDMAEAERTIAGNLSGIGFPPGVDEPRVGRLNPNAFPVLQLSVLGEREIPELQGFVDSVILPSILDVEGVFSADVIGGVSRRVLITADPARLSDMGISLFQVSNALRNNSVTVPAGAIIEEGRTFPVRTTYSVASLDDLRSLVVGFSRPAGAGEAGGPGEGRPVLLSDVADVSIGAGAASSISRTNGKPSLGIAVVKDPDANTVGVTSGVLANLDAVQGLPPDIEIVTISNDGPEIQAQLDTLQREAVFGFMFAVAVVFAFLLTLRPGLLKGLRLTARPTAVIGLSIPLSILTGILLMSLQGMSLNLMTIGGLAISIGRVVDDSIVVLENVYRHIQQGGNRFRVALEATKEVAPAITASTLTTIVVFLPLAFIKGLVGAFFLPFAITVSFALAASLLVALTAVPVLGALLVRPGDFPDAGAGADTGPDRESWMQRAYTPALLWALRHKAATLLAALVTTVGSLGLIALIPITLFPSGGERFLVVSVATPPGASADQTFDAVGRVEGVLARLSDSGVVEVYQATVGTPDNLFAPGASAPGFRGASVFARLAVDAPDDIAESLRAEFASGGDQNITVTELGSGGPPTSGLEMNVTGNDYAEISAVARQLAEQFSTIEGIVNVSSDVTEARDEIVVTIDPAGSAALGLTNRDVATQVNLFMVGQQVTQVAVDGLPTPVFLKGLTAADGGTAALRSLRIVGPLGSAALGDIADLGFEKGPVTISRSDGRRAATITGSITATDTQAIGREVQKKIDAADLPPGVEVTTGGIFQDIAEGFRAIFLAMGIGVVLVYLVMAGALGTLRNPFVIVMSLPLALIGSLTALAITGRTLGLPAMMGMLLLIGIVVTNAIVLIAFVEQLRERGMSVHEALVHGGRVRLRPILMTAFTTSFALLPMAAFVSEQGSLIGVELATVVIGGLASSTFLTLIVIPVVYTALHVTIPELFGRIGSRVSRTVSPRPPLVGDEGEAASS